MVPIITPESPKIRAHIIDKKIFKAASVYATILVFLKWPAANIIWSYKIFTHIKNPDKLISAAKMGLI